MATTKLWAVHSNAGGVIDYDKNPEKTMLEDRKVEDGLMLFPDTVPTVEGQLIAGVNCDPEHAAEEMDAVKEQFGKKGGVLGYHGYISFPGQDGLNPIEVLTVAKKIAEEMWGEDFQVLLSVHTNTDTLHCHFFVNSVSFRDGHKAVNNEKNYYRLKAVTDKVCAEYNLTVTEKKPKERFDKGRLEAELVDIRMASPNEAELKKNLDEHGMKFNKKTGWLRLKNGKAVSLVSINPLFKNLFNYEAPTAVGTPQSAAVAAAIDKDKKRQEQIVEEKRHNGV